MTEYITITLPKALYDFIDGSVDGIDMLRFNRKATLKENIYWYDNVCEMVKQSEVDECSGLPDDDPDKIEEDCLTLIYKKGSLFFYTTEYNEWVPAQPDLDYEIGDGTFPSDRLFENIERYIVNKMEEM